MNHQQTGNMSTQTPATPIRPIRLPSGTMTQHPSQMSDWGLMFRKSPHLTWSCSLSREDTQLFCSSRSKSSALGTRRWHSEPWPLQWEFFSVASKTTRAVHRNLFSSPLWMTRKPTSQPWTTVKSLGETSLEGRRSLQVRFEYTLGMWMRLVLGTA